MKTSSKGKKNTTAKKKTSAAAAGAKSEIPSSAGVTDNATAKAKPAKRSGSGSKKRGSETSRVITAARQDDGPSIEKISDTGSKSELKTMKSAVSPVKRSKEATKKIEVSAPKDAAVADLLEVMSPVDRLLARPELPQLDREDRARLLMQTPTRLYFYWSIKQNPWALLRKVFGNDIGSYNLVVKLTDTRSGIEQINNADAEGNWWFDVRPDGEYQAEIGFYAPNRPYFRIVYSNIIETPRLKPSPRKATEADWTVTADKFAEVLDVAGFTRDAFDVAVAGDDTPRADASARRALQRFTGNNDEVPNAIGNEDIRYALIELAAGMKLDDLRWKISSELFVRLQTSGGDVGAEQARAALGEYFEIDDLVLESEEFGPAVFGASLVNFPKTIRTRRKFGSIEPSYSPEGSHSYRGLRRS